jgi:hypothetical protein
MNRLDLRNAVKDRLAIKSDVSGNSLDGLITNAYVNTSLNDALNRISMERDWWWLASTSSLSFDTVNGAATLPSDFMRANELVINSSPAEWVPLETFLDPTSDNSTYGWTIYGNQAKIVPVPTTTTAGTLYYFRSEPALSSDSSSPLMPAVYHSAIVAYASHLCAARRQDEQRASLYLQEYGTFVKAMNDDNRSTIKRRIKFTRARDYATWE